METKLTYELIIKGRKAGIRDKPFLNGEQITIVGVSVIGNIAGIEYTDKTQSIAFIKLDDISSNLSWEKPKRNFSPYFDFNQAPNGYDFGSVDKDGRAYWYKGKPTIDIDKWRNGGCFCDAGFRQNLVNPETGCVDDWQDSLVERPKGKKNV